MYASAPEPPDAGAIVTGLAGDSFTDALGVVTDLAPWAVAIGLAVAGISWVIKKSKSVIKANK